MSNSKMMDQGQGECLTALIEDMITDETNMCSICCLPHLTEDCPVINTAHRVSDNLLPSKAILTLPPTLEYQQCEGGVYRIVAKTDFVKGTQFGPLDAPRADTFNPRCKYQLQVLDGKSNQFLDTSDESQCNWMTLVPFTTSSAEQNCICYQLGIDIFFTATENISVGCPLAVGYSPGYRALLENAGNPSLSGINTARPDAGTPEHLGDQVDALIKTLETDEFCESQILEDNALSPYTPPSSFEKTELNSPDFSDDEDKITSSDNGDFDEEALSEPSLPTLLELKRQRMTNRIGAVLAMDEWKCKFCFKIFDRTSTFAAHLIEHYKSVGAAKTEKSRLQKVQMDPLCLPLPPSAVEDSQNLLEPRAESFREEESFVDATQVKQEPSKENTSTEEGIKMRISEIDQAFPESFNNTNNATRKRVPKYPYFCDMCANKRIFNRAEYIIRHLMKHARQNLCFVCKKAFPDRKALRDHSCTGDPKRTAVDGKLSAHSCRFCSKSFRNYAILRRHVKSIHCSNADEFHRCQQCSKLFCTTETFKKHACSRKAKKHKDANPRLKEVRSKDKPTDEDDVVVMYKCEICNELFPRLILLERHLRSHGCAFACSFCKKGLTHWTVKSHMKICEVVREFENNSVEVLKCPKCIEVFDELDPFRYHVIQHTHPSMCSYCNIRFSSPTAIRSHKCGRFQCDGCQSVSDNFIDFKRHITSEHEKVQYFCFECAMPFVTEDGFTTHGGCNPKGDKSKRQKSKFHDGIFMCETCGMTYNKWTSLKTHRYTHMERRFFCDTCGKAFHRREILAEHQYVHKDAQFECQVCRKKFKSKKSLEVHTRTHSEIKRFSCNECNRSFVQKVNLLAHQATHLPPEEKGHPCKYCEKKFASKDYLGLHVEAHEKGKHEVCDLCGKSFVKKHMLVQHKKTAHGYRKYYCEFCHLIVRQKHSLTRHLKSRHPELEEVWTREGYIDSRYLQVGSPSSRQDQESTPSQGSFLRQNCVEQVMITVAKRRKTSDPFMNQSKETEIEFTKFEGRAPHGAMLLVELEEDDREIVFTLEDSQDEVLVGSSFNDETQRLE